MPEIVADIRLLSSLHGSGSTIFVPGFDYDSGDGGVGVGGGRTSEVDYAVACRVTLASEVGAWELDKAPRAKATLIRQTEGRPPRGINQMVTMCRDPLLKGSPT